MYSVCGTAIDGFIILLSSPQFSNNGNQKSITKDGNRNAQQDDRNVQDLRQDVTIKLEKYPFKHCFWYIYNEV